MPNIFHLDVWFQKFAKNLRAYLPEDIIIVDLKFLHEHSLLNYYSATEVSPSLTQYFQVIESDNKITLVNEGFVVWIVPEKIDDLPLTYTLIALNSAKKPKLQLCFLTMGVYNSSRLVLRALEKLLFEIQENEKLLQQLKKQK